MEMDNLLGDEVIIDLENLDCHNVDHFFGDDYIFSQKKRRSLGESTTDSSRSATHTPSSQIRNGPAVCRKLYNYKKGGGEESPFLDRRRPRWSSSLTLKDKIDKFLNTHVASRTDVCDGIPTTLSICNQFELSNHEAMVADVDRVHYYRAAIFWSGHEDSDDVPCCHIEHPDSVKEQIQEGYNKLHCNQALIAPQNHNYTKKLSKPRHYCSNKKVLEIGTGPMCVLAMNALNAGAKVVDALEVSTSSARLAAKLMAAYGVSDKIKVFNCHSKTFFFDTESFFGLIGQKQDRAEEIELPPNPPYDMIISEILGDFCSQEGVADVFLDIQRRILFNKPEYIKKVKSIPTSAATMYIPCVFPDAENVTNKALLQEEMTIFSPNYKMMQSVGLKIDNLPISLQWRTLEHLQFEEWMQLQMCQHYESAFNITSSGPMCGFLVGIDVEIRPNEHFGTRYGHCESWYTNVLLYDQEYLVYNGDVVLVRSIANLTNYVTANCMGDKIQASRPSYSIRSYILSPINPIFWDVNNYEVYTYKNGVDSQQMTCPCMIGCALKPVTSVSMATLNKINMDAINTGCSEPYDWLENYKFVCLGETIYHIRLRPPVITIDYKEQSSAAFTNTPSVKRKLPTDPPRRYKKMKQKGI
ncbi:hypothetical protein BBOV_III004530 [Babesia bovis T2Bo]|uniref:Uncharacterized protein n=1 Tax=Babesia bovis TaxID=5865 RepID=A7AN82_BABBO|nr:hypothetical protein BBOV_III004530 [Babesia bovis T2Bo]EDO08016.1 hypothetical protein BBOV_III004530 [Babesia bovis T2Bo]|eukprot:XP_001611584.1 hypothetical protein [Babesia bovis T2Bo]